MANEGNLTVALDIVLNEELIIEGLAREVINRIQNYRKDSQLDVVDKICVQITKHPQMEQVLALFGQHIASETLAEQIVLVEKIDAEDKISAELVKDLTVEMLIEKA